MRNHNQQTVSINTITKTINDFRNIRQHLRHPNIYVRFIMITIKEYVDKSGNIPFAKWFDSLNAEAAAKVAAALIRIEAENYSNVKSVGAGVHEYKINFGPGYRVYFGKDGNELIILLGGGTKKRQQNDVEKAKELWMEYKKEKEKTKKKKR